VLLKDKLGIFIGSVDLIKGEVKTLEGKSLGTIQRFNPEGIPYSLDARFQIKKDITGSLILKDLIKGKGG